MRINKVKKIIVVNKMYGMVSWIRMSTGMRMSNFCE